MGNFRRNVVVGSIMTGIALTGSACESYPTNYMNSSDAALVEKTVTDTGKFWAIQGLTDGNTLKAQVAVGNDTFNCGGVEVTSDSLNSAYCKEDNVLNISVGLINQARTTAGSENAEVAIRGAVRHAVGEFVLQEDPHMSEYPPTDEDEAAMFIDRERACLGGIATYNVAMVDNQLSGAAETPVIYQTYLHTGDSRDFGGIMAKAYSEGYEAQTQNRNVCIGI